MDQKKACKCKYCDRETFNKNDDYCIFHSKDIEGKKNQFNEAFNKEFKLQDQKKDNFNFNYFIFPNDFDYFKENTIKKNIHFYFATFEREVDFLEAKFKGNADFLVATFEGNANFRQATFVGPADFRRTTFVGGTDFSLATFKEWARFDGATFKGADFVGVTFKGVAVFSETTFVGGTDFSLATFKGVADFYGVTFKKGADFSEATFKEKADFIRVTFEGVANFKRATFKGKADFLEAKFKGNADFLVATFEGNANFRQATFVGPADFRRTTFVGGTDFSLATFKEWARFDGATFKGADFVGVTFKGVAVFSETTFVGGTDFSLATFKGVADFYGVTFKKGADFSEATFKEKADFIRVTFEGVANFKRATFKGETIVGVKGINCNKLNLEDTFFYDLRGLLDQVEKEIKNNNLDNIYYIINVSKKTSSNNILNKLKNWFINCVINRFRITKFVNNQINPILGERTTKRYPIIARTINDDNYLMRFKIKHSNWFFLWWFFADCGRGFFRWALWSFLMAMGFAYKFYSMGPSAFNFVGGLPHKFGTMIYYSVVTFTTLGFGDITPKTLEASRWLMAEVILGYVMLGGLISIFANKIARRS